MYRVLPGQSGIVNTGVLKDDLCSSLDPPSLSHLLLVGAHQGNLGQLLQHLLLDNLDNFVSFSLSCQTFQRPTLYPLVVTMMMRD